jgi:hypothetical protein
MALDLLSPAGVTSIAGSAVEVVLTSWASPQQRQKKNEVTAIVLHEQQNGVAVAKLKSSTSSRPSTIRSPVLSSAHSSWLTVKETIYDESGRLYNPRSDRHLYTALPRNATTSRPFVPHQR